MRWGLLFVLLAALPLASGCKKKVEEAAPELVLTPEKTATEERNLRALCKASAEVAAMPGVQDRMARVAEIAAPTSDTTALVDGLQAMEGPERLNMIRAFVKKYGLANECAAAIRVFDRAAPAPSDGAAGAGGVDPNPNALEHGHGGASRGGAQGDPDPGTGPQPTANPGPNGGAQGDPDPGTGPQGAHLGARKTGPHGGPNTDPNHGPDNDPDPGSGPRGGPGSPAPLAPPAP